MLKQRADWLKTDGESSHSDRDAGGRDLCGGLSLEATRCRCRPGGGTVLRSETHHKVTGRDTEEGDQEVTTAKRLQNTERVEIRVARILSF